MNEKNGLLLAGLMLLGTVCTSQLEAFNLKNLVPACIQQYIECKKLEHEKAALKRRIADIRQYLTYIEQEISDLLERLCIQEKIRCQFNIHVGPDFYDRLVRKYADLEMDKRKLEDELKSITDKLEKLNNKPQ